MSKLSDAQLREIKERADKATGGPWEWDVRVGRVMLQTVKRGNVYVMGFVRAGMRGAVPVVQIHKPDCDGMCSGCGVMERVDKLGEPDYNGRVHERHQDMDFIVHARTDIPALLSHIDTLTAELAECKAALKPFADEYIQQQMVAPVSDGSLVNVKYGWLRRAALWLKLTEVEK